jgi:serine/threonine-protein kinase
MGPQPSIAHYRITAKLGEGGMGEVWRATDTKLNRDVAVKILPDIFARDPDRMARFTHEAQVLASLNHPNIAAIYGVEDRALVMELVDGVTLAERIAQGRVPLNEALPIALQIADALEAAHERGIVHRDLKPANVKLTSRGVVKVLDFGLAKALGDESSASHGADRATLTMRSAPGAIVGTAAYMSPEQAKGTNVDRRADVWAFGVVLYEMLTGARPFPGDSPSEVMAAILRDEPVWDRVPAEALGLLQSCLEKDPRNRLRDIADARLLLGNSSVLAAPSRSSWVPWAAVVLLAGAAGWGWLRARPSQPRMVSRWTVPLAAADPVSGFGIAVSRDGRHLAYAEGTPGSSRIILRRLDQVDAKPVPGTEGGVRPFFSPNGQWIAYFTGMGGPLKKVAVQGGMPITLCEDASYFGGSWGDDDRIVFSAKVGTVLKQVRAAGGACEDVTAPDVQNGEFARRWPQILPGGGSMLLTIGTNGSYDNAEVAVFDRAKKSVRVLVRGASVGRYVPSGHLVYVRGGTIFAAPFDLNHLAITGPEAPVIEGVYYTSGGGFADFSFSDSGLLLYMQETRPTTLSTLDWADRNGSIQHSSLPLQRYGERRGMARTSNLRLSPDGKRAAVTMVSGAGLVDVWIADLVRGTLNRLTSEGTNYQPVWTPDGKRVAFNSGGRQARGIYWAAADGSGKAELLLESADPIVVPDAWSPDGKTLLYETLGRGRIWALTVPRTGNQPRMISEQAGYNEGQAHLSPDGRWMVYVSDESGRNQVYVRPFPGPGSKAPISIEGGENPRWSADGREIFYFDPAKNQVVAVGIQTGTTIVAGPPHALFEQWSRDWDAASDGKRFLVRTAPRTAESQARLQVVLNWFDELPLKVHP